MTKRIVAIDTETWLLEPGLMAPPLVCVTTAESGKDSQLIHRRDPNCLLVLQAYLEDPNVVVVGQNFAYDAAVIIQAFPELTSLVFDKYEAGLICDTQIREQLMDIASDRLRHGRYSLKALVKSYFDTELEKDEWRLRYKELDNVPVSEWPSGAKDYATLDAEYTLQVYEAQASAADDYLDEKRPYALINETAQTAGAFALHLTAAWGIRTNKASVDLLESSTRARLEELKDVLIQAEILILKSKKKGSIGGYRKSTSAVWKLVEEAYADDEDGVPVTATGRTKTDRLTLSQSESPLLQTVSDYVETQKILSTYVPLLHRAAAKPLNTRYGMANSGRTTASPNCFSGDTEVLTPIGWVPFHALDRTEKVAQWDKDGTVTFVQPTEFFYEKDRSVVRLLSTRTDLILTPDHRCLVKTRTGAWEVHAADSVPEDRKQLHAGYGPCGDSDNALFAEFVMATQADGHFRKDDQALEFALTKKRKAERLCYLLSELKIPYAARTNQRNGELRYRFRVRRDVVATMFPMLIGEAKLLSFDWLFSLNRATQKHLIDWLWFWDGFWAKKTHYATEHKHNADWVQTLCVLNDVAANIRKYVPSNPNAVVSWQVDRTSKNYSWTSNMDCAPAGVADVYCVAVPSSFLIVRRNHKVVVSGNCQNFPRKEGLRESIEARDGFLFCSVDYDTAELRALAQFCEQTFGYSQLADALRRGDDPHLMLAATILGITHEEAKQRKGDKDVKDARQVSKLVNFGLPGGMGVDTFITNCAKQGVTLTRERVKELIEAYKTQWPEMADFFQMASQATKTSTGMGDVYTPWSGRLRANCFYSAYLNQHFQGPVADLAKAALFAVAYECFTGYCYPGTEQTADGLSPLYGARPTLFVHDEVIAEVSADPDLGDRQARRMALVMRSVGERTISTIPMTCEPALMKRWTKNSKSVLDEKGRYVSCNV